MFGDIRAVERVQPSCQWSCVSYSHPAGCNLSSCQSERKGLGFSGNSVSVCLNLSTSPVSFLCLLTLCGAFRPTRVLFRLQVCLSVSCIICSLRNDSRCVGSWITSGSCDAPWHVNKRISGCDSSVCFARLTGLDFGTWSLQVFL